MTEEELQEIEQRLAASLSRDLFDSGEAGMIRVLTIDVPRLIDVARESSGQ